MNNLPRLIGIATRKKTRATMVTLKQCPITTEFGVGNDCRGKPGLRQVTVLSYESWQQACKELNTELPWLLRRANLLITGISFSSADVGKVITIGKVKLKICRETDPCHRMETSYPGLLKALTPDWQGGVCCQVIHAGTVALEDTVSLTD
ncbi:MAG: MOSC domain-containing protein [Spongiibacteraceae bacterium]